ncbi:preprotein translocase subunit SecD [Aurantiacibacter gilvus]|uniref:SecDF P1 head subdomain domain-containing protein n=1 Tax=Aurantiacibacter gilvus TaxID=3139141 RepID=A0ABU9IH06_9SPHN
MFDLIRTRLAALLLVAAASLGLAACDLAAAPAQEPTKRFVIQADLDEIAQSAGDENSVDDLLAESMEVIRRRVGSNFHSITYEGDGRIVLETSGSVEGSALAALIGPTGELDFRMVDPDALPMDVIEGIAPPGSEILPMADDLHGGSMAVRRLGGISGGLVVSARPAIDENSGQPVLHISFDQRGQEQLARLTTENVGRQMAVVFDDEILMAPIIHEPILSGSLQVAGGFTEESANELAIILASGMLPTPFTLVEETVITPGD